MELEAIKIVKEIITHKEDFDYAYGAKIERPYAINHEQIQAIETVLQALERYKRLAVANLKDSKEFQDNMCKHRCILKSQLQELEENSIPKKKIEDKIKEIKEEHKKQLTIETIPSHTFGLPQEENGIFGDVLKILQELLEE